LFGVTRKTVCQQEPDPDGDEGVEEGVVEESVEGKGGEG